MKTLAEAYAKKDLADMIKDPVVDAYEELDAFSCIYGGMFGVFNKAINAACKDPNASENISIRINQSMHRSLEALSNAK